MFPKFDLMKIYYESNASGGTIGAGTGAASSGANSEDQSQNEQGAPASFETFEKWFESLPEETKKLATPAKEHFERMQNTVKATRDERDDFSKQLRELSKKVETGSETQKKLDEIASNLDNANKKAAFYEEAYTQQCQNPKAAYAYAVANDLFSSKGAPDWKKIKEEIPQLFGTVSQKPKRPSSGSGTGEEPASTGTMTDWIRNQAGVTPS